MRCHTCTTHCPEKLVNQQPTRTDLQELLLSSWPETHHSDELVDLNNGILIQHDTLTLITAIAGSGYPPCIAAT